MQIDGSRVSASASRVSEVGPIWPHLQHGSAGVGRDEVTEFLGHFNPQGLAVRTNCPDWKIEVILPVLVDRWIDLSHFCAGFRLTHGRCLTVDRSSWIDPWIDRSIHVDRSIYLRG